MISLSTNKAVVSSSYETETAVIAASDRLIGDAFGVKAAVGRLEKLAVFMAVDVR